VFDYAYSWGTQNSDQALEGSTALQAVFSAHNATSAGPWARKRERQRGCDGRRGLSVAQPPGAEPSSAFAIYAALVFERAGRPGPRRRLRRRRPFFASETGAAAAAFFCAIFSATAFGGRPGPPGRHVPRVLRRRRRRFGAGFVGETVLNNEWTAERTSCCTMSRITVTRLFCLGIECSFLSRHIRGAMNG